MIKKWISLVLIVIVRFCTCLWNDFCVERSCSVLFVLLCWEILFGSVRTSDFPCHNHGGIHLQTVFEVLPALVRRASNAWRQWGYLSTNATTWTFRIVILLFMCLVYWDWRKCVTRLGKNPMGLLFKLLFDGIRQWLQLSDMNRHPSRIIDMIQSKEQRHYTCSSSMTLTCFFHAEHEWTINSSALTSFPKYSLVGRASMSRNGFTKRFVYATPLSTLKPGLNKGHLNAFCLFSWQIMQKFQFISKLSNL